MSDTVAESVPDTVPARPPTVPPIAEGDPVARLEIPEIGLDVVVVAGVSVDDLKRGPGHYPDTPLPGQFGNAAIAGHRTTYGQPFLDIDDLDPGDQIIATTLAGRFVYAVTGTEIVEPDDTHVVATTNPDIAELTLTSCHPKWSASQRIIVHSALVADESAVVGYAAGAAADHDDHTRRPSHRRRSRRPSRPTTGDTHDDDTHDRRHQLTRRADDRRRRRSAHRRPTRSPTAGSTTARRSPRSRSGRWSSRPSRSPPTCSAGGSTAGSLGIAAGIIPFLIALYFFYQNVNRLLPAKSVTLTRMIDPVRARRAQIARWTLLANRIGYLVLALAIALFVIAFATGLLVDDGDAGRRVDDRVVRAPGALDHPRLRGQGGRARRSPARALTRSTSVTLEAADAAAADRVHL